MKEQEYSDYVRGETGKSLDPLSLTPAEQQARNDYERSTALIVSVGRRLDAAESQHGAHAGAGKALPAALRPTGAASKGLSSYYARLYSVFGNNSDANRQLADVKGSVIALRRTIAKMPHTVALSIPSPARTAIASLSLPDPPPQPANI